MEELVQWSKIKLRRDATRFPGVMLREDGVQWERRVTKAILERAFGVVGWMRTAADQSAHFEM